MEPRGPVCFNTDGIKIQHNEAYGNLGKEGQDRGGYDADYNCTNTHFVREGLDVSVFPEGRTPINSLFENNIFFFEDRGEWGKNAEGINTSFRNNVYFNLPVHPSETRPIVGDPLFVQPGLARTDVNLKTMESLLGYRLKPTSPCIDTGLPIAVPGGVKDLFGSEVRMDRTDIGAVERARAVQ